MLAHSCHGAHSNLGQASKTSPQCAAQDARNKPAAPWERMANDTGGKDERLREHRIGHFRLQACGGCDCDARIAFATAFTLGDIRICWDGCWCDGGKADLES